MLSASSPLYKVSGQPTVLLACERIIIMEAARSCSGLGWGGVGGREGLYGLVVGDM